MYLYLDKKLSSEQQHKRFGGYNRETIRAAMFLVFGMFGLVTYPQPPKFGRQGVKGGDFLSDPFKKYYPNLSWRIAFWKDRIVLTRNMVSVNIETYSNV